MQIALSLTEAEHISLSQSFRDLTISHNISNELSKVEFMIKDKKISKTYSAAYKGNRGAFELA